MTEVHVFTSAALNYVPKVRMLFQSVRRHHPEWRLHLALADELPPGVDLSGEPLDSVVEMRELGIPAWRGWSFCHQLVELATAIKPFMLQRLLAVPGCASVIYLDPDIVVFSPLHDILASLEEANLALTPHQTLPESSLDAVMSNEISSLKFGIYNLGFLGVAATEVGRAFAAWWSQRLYHFCRDDTANGLFTDQRWIDLVPALFPGIAVLRSPRHNVATWNLTTRHLSRTDKGDCDEGGYDEGGYEGGYEVDGQPLGFYHFTGFDSGNHRLMAEKYATASPAVRQLVQWYARATETAQNDPLTAMPWAYGHYSDGSPITLAQRRCYRDNLRLQRQFPDPYDASGYLRWYAANQPPAPGDTVLTPGFMAGESELDWGRVGQLLRQALRRPGMGLMMARRGWELLRNEGVASVRRRLQR